MKTNRPRFFLVLLILAAALGFGTGALSTSLTQEVFAELGNRAMRAATLRDIFQYTGSTDAAAYFQGRADAYMEAAQLVSRAHETGSTAPVLPEP